MFEITIQMFSQLIDIFPVLFLLYVIFDLIGSLLFNKR